MNYIISTINYYYHQKCTLKNHIPGTTWTLTPWLDRFWILEDFGFWKFGIWKYIQIFKWICWVHVVVRTPTSFRYKTHSGYLVWHQRRRALRSCVKKRHIYLQHYLFQKGTYVYINYACFSCCQPLTAQCPRPRTLTSSSNICPFHLPTPSPFVFSLVVVGLACCRWLQACWLPLQQLLQQLLWPLPVSLPSSELELRLVPESFLTDWKLGDNDRKRKHGKKHIDMSFVP